MASPLTVLFALVFITTTSSLLPLSSVTATDNFLAPFLSPLIGEFCKEVGCGKGKCKTSPVDSEWPYECECDPGWKQLFSSSNSSLKLLPCVIPNCTLDLACSEAADPPAQSMETPSNPSIIDPCSWANCGGGICNKTTQFTYTCDCKEGYYNLLNNTGFPCLRQCSIGGDCTNLGIIMGNKTSAPPPNLPVTSAYEGRSLQHEVLSGMIMLAIAVNVLVM